jgi:DNA-binding XRE family transcriptional regulator
MTPNVRFEDWEADQMRDPEFRAIAEEREPAYQLARLRILRGLTQEQLAALVGTKQPRIARLESGPSSRASHSRVRWRRLSTRRL